MTRSVGTLRHNAGYLFLLLLVSGCSESHLGADPSAVGVSLQAIELSSGSLHPAFSPDVTDYGVSVGVEVQSISMQLGVPDGASATIDGRALRGGDTWQSPKLMLGRNRFEIVLTETGNEKLYVLSVVRESHDRAEEAYLKDDSQNWSSDQFGTSVAVSGNVLVVGAPGESSEVPGGPSGAAFVFERGETGWIQTAYLKASNVQAGDWFGQVVAISGDVIAIGAPGEDSSASGVDGDRSDDSLDERGAVYVFARDGEGWSEQAYLKSSAANAWSGFGRNVAVSGETIVAGASQEGDAHHDPYLSGSVYVFVREQGNWSLQARIQPDTPGDGFASDVSISGDTIVAGAPGADGSSGAAYVFTRDENAWSQEAYIQADDASISSDFGRSVSISGNTFVVGALPLSSPVAGVPGAAYVFVRDGSEWTQQARIGASNADFDDNFGHAVALSNETLVVGAPWESSASRGIDSDGSNNNAEDSGAAYVFAREAGEWTQVSYLKASNADAFDNFGYGVAISGDAIVVGAPGEGSFPIGSASDPLNNDASAGAAYVFN